MNKFLCRALMFSLLMFFVLAVIDYVYSFQIRRSNYLHVEAWKDLIEGNIQADVVFVGNSRASLQIDPEIIDSVLCTNSFNLGMEGSPINRQVQKYGIYRDRNDKPRLIIQNIDAWSLAYSVGYEIRQFFPYFWVKDMRNIFFRTEPFSFAEKYIPFYRYHGLNPKMFLKSEPLSFNKGYIGIYTRWNGTDFLKQDSIEFIVNDTTYRMFDSYLESVVEDSIKVVFVYAPLYYGATQKISNIDEMYATYKNLADKYSIPILDYSDMWICHDTTYFYNAMHLNIWGAEIYTDSLANDIKRLGIY